MSELEKRHPAFEPGNELALKHGGNSERAIAARAAEVHAELITFAPWLDRPAFAPAVSRYLTAAAREQLLHQHIADLSQRKGPGAVPARVWEQCTAAARLAAKLGQDLGIDPIGHARIAALSATASAQETLAEHRERGRQILAGRTDLIDADAANDDSADCTDDEELDK